MTVVHYCNFLKFVCAFHIKFSQRLNLFETVAQNLGHNAFRSRANFFASETSNSVHSLGLRNPWSSTARTNDATKTDSI